MKVQIGIKKRVDNYERKKYMLVTNNFMQWEEIYELESEEILMAAYLANGEVALRRAVEAIKALAYANKLELRVGEDGVIRAV